MNKKLQITIVAIAIFAGGYFYLSSRPAFDLSNRSSEEKSSSHIVNEALAAQFDYLSKNGNSSCLGGFKDSIVDMSDDARLTSRLGWPKSLCPTTT